jgi:hypothetical protein
VVSRRREAMEQRKRERQEAERRAREEEAARRREREYQRALAAGGAVAVNARWERLCDETQDKYGGGTSSDNGRRKTTMATTRAVAARTALPTSAAGGTNGSSSARSRSASGNAKPRTNGRRTRMFGREKTRPNLPAFQHANDCKIVGRDPSVEIPWSEIRAGVLGGGLRLR